MTDHEFSLRLKQLREGYRLWKELMAKYELSNEDYVIAFPHHEDPVNHCGLSHLEQFIEYRHAKKVLMLLMEDNDMGEWIDSKKGKENILIEIISEKTMEEIIACYSVNKLFPHFIMMSLTRPDGRYGDKVLRKGITLDEVVTLGIYQMTEREIYDKSRG